MPMENRNIYPRYRFVILSVFMLITVAIEIQWLTHAAVARPAEVFYDGQFDPGDIPRIIKPIQDNQADMVTCTRFLKKEWIPKMPRVKKIGNSIFTKFISMLTKQQFSDTLCR